MTDLFKKLGKFLSFKETENSENIKETKDRVRNSNFYFEILKNLIQIFKLGQGKFTDYS